MVNNSVSFRFVRHEPRRRNPFTFSLEGTGGGTSGVFFHGHEVSGISTGTRNGESGINIGWIGNSTPEGSGSLSGVTVGTSFWATGSINSAPGWASILYEAGSDAESGGSTIIDQTYNDINTGVAAFGIGWSTKEVMIQGAVAKARGISRAKVNSISNIRTLGVAGARYMNVVKQVSGGTIIFGAGITIADGFANGFQAHHAADLGIQAIIYGISASVPVAGWIVGGAYFLADMFFQNTHHGQSITEYYLDGN